MFTIAPFTGISNNLKAMRVELEFQISAILSYLRVILQIVKSVRPGKVVLTQPILAFVGETSDYPALARSGNALTVRSGDDSGYAGLGVAAISIFNTGPTALFYVLGAPANQKIWQYSAGTTTYALKIWNDSWSTQATVCEYVRSGTALVRNKSMRACQQLPTTADDAGLAPENLDMYFYLQSNTSLRVRVRGSDGTVREGVVPLI